MQLIFNLHTLLIGAADCGPFAGTELAFTSPLFVCAFSSALSSVNELISSLSACFGQAFDCYARFETPSVGWTAGLEVIPSSIKEYQNQFCGKSTTFNQSISISFCLHFGSPLAGAPSTSSLARFALKDLISNSRRCSRALSFQVYRSELMSWMLLNGSVFFTYVKRKPRSVIKLNYEKLWKVSDFNPTSESV